MKYKIYISEKKYKLNGEWFSYEPPIYREGNIVQDTEGDCDEPIEGATIAYFSDGTKQEYNIVGTLTADYFKENTSITRVEIGNTVTRINNQAFQKCTEITAITVSDSVTTILGQAFENCNKLQSITLPTVLASWGSFVFNSCGALTSITIPNGVTTIPQYHFNYCTSLTEIEIPEGITTIDTCAFRNCTKLTSVTIPDSVTTINTTAFMNVPTEGKLYCDENWFSGLTDEQITNLGNVYNWERPLKPKNMIYINWYEGENLKGDWFYYDTNTIDDSIFDDFGKENIFLVTIYDGFTEIASSAFQNCTRLAYLSIPDTVTSIGDKAFFGCSSLKSVEIPNSVETITSYTFGWCTSLSSVTIPNTVTRIGDYAFQNCSSLASINYNGTIAQWRAIYKGLNWAYYVPSSCKVHCTDGDISI